MLDDRLRTIASSLRAASRDDDHARAVVIGHTFQRVLVSHLRARVGERLQHIDAVPNAELELVVELLARTRTTISNAAHGVDCRGAAQMVAALTECYGQRLRSHGSVLASRSEGVRCRPVRSTGATGAAERDRRRMSNRHPSIVGDRPDRAPVDGRNPS
jgi:hypothetical protein